MIFSLENIMILSWYILLIFFRANPAYFNVSSHPGIVQRYIDCTEILLKHAGLCCVFVFSPKTSENISSIDDDAEETYSLCYPSRPQWQSRQFGLFSVYEKLRVEKWGKNKSLWQSQSPTLPLWTSRRPE